MIWCPLYKRWPQRATFLQLILLSEWAELLQNSYLCFTRSNTQEVHSALPKPPTQPPTLPALSLSLSLSLSSTLSLTPVFSALALSLSRARSALFYFIHSTLTPNLCRTTSPSGATPWAVKQTNKQTDRANTLPAWPSFTAIKVLIVPGLCPVGGFH